MTQTAEQEVVRKTFTGEVVSRTEKTIVLRVDRQRMHPRYGKVMRLSRKVHAHDEKNEAGVGDTVRVIACRPMSKTKRWRLTDIVERAK